MGWGPCASSCGPDDNSKQRRKPEENGIAPEMIFGAVMVALLLATVGYSYAQSTTSQSKIDMVEVWTTCAHNCL